MSHHHYDAPKNGQYFRVLRVQRISTINQDEKSLDDQGVLVENYVNQLLAGHEIQYKSISSRGSGQNLERSELLDLTADIESGEFDLVVAEDLGRICRRMHAVILCESAEDSGTRVIAINDNIDTAQPDWRLSTVFASYRHESYCRDTSARIRRSLRNRFMQGGIFLSAIYGYVKPHAKASDAEVYKDPDAEPIYDHWFEMLEKGCGYGEVADWLNDTGVPVGPHSRSKKWTGKMVRRITFTKILKGLRTRNETVTRRVNKTGRSKVVAGSPEDLLTRSVPHLAFIDPERYDRVIRLLVKRNAKYKRSESVRNDPRAGIPKRQTVWPAQHIRCGVCGRLYVRGGHGKTHRMMCNGARDHACWNGMTVSGADTAHAIADFVRQHIQSLPKFDENWRAEYESQREAQLSANNGELARLEAELEAETRKLENLFDLLARIGVSDATVDRIRQSEIRVADLTDQISRLRQSSQSQPELPSLEQIQAVAVETFRELAVEDKEFARLMRNSIDEFFVLPYRLADGGHIQPRVTFRVSLMNLLGNTGGLDLPIQHMHGVVDLMRIPQRVTILTDVVRLVGSGMSHGDVAKQLGVFKSEVGYAMQLHRQMLKKGTSDPWIPVTSASQAVDYFKLIRNKRFDFDPLPGSEVTRHPTT